MRRSGWAHFLRLLAYALPYKPQVAAQFGCMAFSVALGLLKPWPLKVLVDNVAGGQPFAFGGWTPAVQAAELLVLTCLAFLLLHGADASIQFGSAMASTTLSARMTRDLRADVLGGLQRLSLRFHDSHRVGDLVHRVTLNTNAVETAFQSGFMGVVKSVVLILSMFAVMLALDPLLTVVTLAIVPVLVACIRWYGKRIYSVSREHQDREGSVSSKVQEILASIRLVKAFGQEEAEMRRFDEISRASVSTRVKTTWTQSGFGLLVALVFAVGTAALFFFGMRLVSSGALTVGEFLVFNAYVGMIYGPLSVLSYTASSVQSALGGGSRLFEILDAEPEIKDRPGAVELTQARGVLEATGLTFAYEPGKPVLNNIDLRVEPGEMLAIVGETGGGKTTLLNLLLRLYEPDEGRIELDGRDLRQIRIRSLRRLISLAPQDTLLLSGSIRENIAYGRSDADDEAIERAARDAEAHAFIMELPRAYDTLVGERGVRLSTGQRQRIAIARALLRDSPVVLLDEPTSALDAETESRLVDRLRGRMRDRAVVLVAHRLSMVVHADRIAVLHHGEIVERGGHEELLAADGAYARLWRAQTSRRPSPLVRP